MSTTKLISIKKNKDGTFVILGSKIPISCNDKHDVGANLEQALWPLLEPMLDNANCILIRISHGFKEND